MLEEPCVFVDVPAIYEPKGDHIVAKWKGREFYMPIWVAQEASNGLNGALADWRRGHARTVLKLAPREH